MRILLILLTLVAAPAWAEWVKVEESNIANFYIDPATIRKDGNMRRVWMVRDLKERNKAGERSNRFLGEYDCKDERYRLLSHSAHTETMLGGNVLYSGDVTDNWSYIPPGSVIVTVLKIVCAK
jgi:hypothetical protein